MGTEKDRDSRTNFMAALNAAYAQCDEVRMREILHEWNSRSITNVDDIGSELIRLIRKIAQLEEAIQKADDQITKLNESDLSKLCNRVASLHTVGRDLLEEMRHSVQQTVNIRSQQLDTLRRGKQWPTISSPRNRY